MDLLVAQADLLVEHEDIIFEVLVDPLKLSDFLLELVATLVGTAQLFRPNVLLALVGAKLGSTTRAVLVRVIVLTSQSV